MRFLLCTLPSELRTAAPAWHRPARRPYFLLAHFCRKLSVPGV